MANHKLFKVEEYTLKDGDTFDSIVAGKGITARQLKLFNFGTEDEAEIRKYFWGRLHCRDVHPTGAFKFEASDKPGKLFIPKLTEPPLTLASNATHQIKTKTPRLGILKPSKCIVKFRPGAGWDGGYGFDWMREGDSGGRGDLKYLDNMHDAANVTKLKTRYRHFEIDEAKDDDSKGETTAAFLALFPADECAALKHTVTIKMKLDQRAELPAKLKVESTRADYKTYIDILEELPKTAGDHDITVKSKTACSDDIELDIFNYTNDKKGKEKKINVGKLVIIKNDLANRPTAKVVFVRVATNINGPRQAIPATYVTQMESLLKKNCEQALVHLSSATEELNMTVSRDFRTRIKAKKLFKVQLTEAETFIRDWTIPHPDAPKKWVFLTDSYKKLSGTSRIKVHQELSKIFKAKCPLYRRHYPIFMFNEQGFAVDAPAAPSGKDISVGLNGVADSVPGSNVLVFGDQDDATVSHELFHTLGLHHPFYSGSLLQFKNHGTGGETYCSTDNIMDYSHFVEPPIPMFQTWRWQWEILNTAVKNKVWP